MKTRKPGLEWPAMTTEQLDADKGKILSHDETIDGEKGQIITPGQLRDWILANATGAPALDYDGAEKDTGRRYTLNGQDLPIYTKEFHVTDLVTPFVTGWKEPNDMIVILHYEVIGISFLNNAGGDFTNRTSLVKFEYTGVVGSKNMIVDLNFLNNLNDSDALIFVTYIKGSTF